MFGSAALAAWAFQGERGRYASSRCCRAWPKRTTRARPGPAARSVSRSTGWETCR